MANEKKRILIVAPYPRAKAPSQRFRFEQYMDFLNSKGYEFDYKSFWTENAWKNIYKKGKTVSKVFYTMQGVFNRFLLLFKIKRYRFIFLHREALPIGPPVWEWIVAKIFRKPIIFDFDDAIWLPNNSQANAKLVGRFKNHGKTANIISWSKKVIAGNQFLAEYATQFNRNTDIIPTTIDTENHHNTSKVHSYKECITIGWTGTHSTLNQLIRLYPVLNNIFQIQPFKFLLISDFPPHNMPSFVEFKPWKRETEIEDLLLMDIGIMPLMNTKWEKGKCGFKALQYMALGIPPIISEVGVNADIVEHGVNGYLVNPKNEENWENCLLKLMQNYELRAETGARARNLIEEKYSVLSWREKYFRIFEETGKEQA